MMLHKCDIDPHRDTTFILLNVKSTELLRDFWTQNKVIIIIIMMSRVVINGSGLAACRSVNFICSIYDLSKYDISLS